MSAAGDADPGECGERNDVGDLLEFPGSS